MIRQLLAALSFLTAIPAGRRAFDAKEIGRSARWFPLVGAMIGAVYIGMLRVFSSWFPPGIVAILIILAEALITGGLHLDGLADTADGLGGGRTPDDALRIMRDHAIGSYGAIALILIILLKAAAAAVLIERHQAERYLFLAPVLGRWSTVVLGCALPYARPGSAVSNQMGKTELAIATLVVALAAASAGVQGVISVAIALAATAVCGLIYKRKIKGVTGDTLGATVEITETLTLLAGVMLR
jgi:cobalamin 5'-phosphate synthase/cobalamin synthase